MHILQTERGEKCMKLRDCIKKEFQKDVSEFGKKKAIILYILFIMLGFITALAAVIIHLNEDIGMILMLIAFIMAVVVLTYIIIICRLTKDESREEKS